MHQGAGLFANDTAPAPHVLNAFQFRAQVVNPVNVFAFGLSLQS
jgi:hypothetical protein